MAGKKKGGWWVIMFLDSFKWIFVFTMVEIYFINEDIHFNGECWSNVHNGKHYFKLMCSNTNTRLQ